MFIKDQVMIPVQHKYFWGLRTEPYKYPAIFLDNILYCLMNTRYLYKNSGMFKFVKNSVCAV